jgi:hypothetical protein
MGSAFQSCGAQTPKALFPAVTFCARFHSSIGAEVALVCLPEAPSGS